MKKTIVIVVILLFLSSSQEWATPLKVYAKENQVEESIIDQLSFDQVEEQLAQLFPTDKLSLSKLVKNIMSGNGADNKEYLTGILKNGWKTKVGDIRKIFMTIILMGLVSAIFSNFSKLFQSHQVADISHYLLYLLFVTVLLKTFQLSMDIARNTMENLLLFIKIIIPAFCAAVSVAGGITSAAVFYQLTLFIIFAVEALLIAGVIPAIYTYVFLSMINGIMEDDRMQPFLELIQKGIKSVLKTAILVITGLGVLQSMIAPVMDSVKTVAVQKTISMIPGIGNIADTITHVVIGSAVLVKNSIGVVLFLLLLAMCASPLMEILLLTGLLKGSAAMIGMVADRKVTKCIQQTGEGCGLLLRTVVTALSLFVIVLAIMSIMTNRGF